MATKELSVRLSLDGAPRVIRDMTAAGAAGDKSLHRIAAAAAPASRALQTVSSVASDIRGRLEGMAGRMGILGNAMAALGPAGLAAAAGIVAAGGAIAAAGYGVTKFVGGVVDTGRQFENFRMQLTALEGSSAGAEKALNFAQKMAKTTALSMPEVVQAYAQLRAFGIDPTAGSLQALVDTAAKQGKGFEQVSGMALALGQAWTKTKLQGDEALQLIERGVPVWDLLSKATGRSVVELQKLSEKGLLTRKAISILIAEMGKASTGASDRFSKAWDGLVSNLGDSWIAFQRLVGDTGVFSALEGILRRVAGYVDSLDSSGALQRIAKVIGEPLTMAFQGAGLAIDNFIASQGGIQAFASTVEDYIGRFVVSLTGGSTNVKDFSALITEKIGDAQKSFADLATVVSAVASAIRGLMSLAEKAGQGLQWLREKGVLTNPLEGGIGGIKAAAPSPVALAATATAPAVKWLGDKVSWLFGGGGQQMAPAAAAAGGTGSLAAPAAAPALGPAAPSARPQPQQFGPYAARQQQVGVGGAIEINIKSQQPVEARATKQSGPVKLNINQGLALGMP